MHVARKIALGLGISVDGYIARPDGAVDFLKADLVDELHVGIVPVLLGEGIPFFPSGFPQREFSLIENNTYSRGLIALKYRRTRAKSKSKS